MSDIVLQVVTIYAIVCLLNALSPGIALGPVGVKLASGGQKVTTENAIIE